MILIKLSIIRRNEIELKYSSDTEENCETLNYYKDFYKIAEAVTYIVNHLSTKVGDVTCEKLCYC